MQLHDKSAITANKQHISVDCNWMIKTFQKQKHWRRNCVKCVKFVGNKSLLRKYDISVCTTYCMYLQDLSNEWTNHEEHLQHCLLTQCGFWTWGIATVRMNVFIIQSKSKNGLIKTSPPTWEWYLDKLLEYAMCRTELKELPSKALLCYIWARWYTRLSSKGEFSSPRDVVLSAVGRAQSDNLPRCSAINDICRSGKIYIPLIWKFIWPTYSL